MPEYKRNFAPEGAPPMERMFATVLFGNDKNAAELLISDGLATVGRTGQVQSLPGTRPTSLAHGRSVERTGPC